MLKKFIYVVLAIFLVLLISNVVYANDVLTNLNLNTSNLLDNIVINDTNQNLIEDTTISDETNTTTDSELIQSVITTTTTDYEDSGELSISNMINIILIVVGVVLILLGIAILIKLK